MESEQKSTQIVHISVTLFLKEIKTDDEVQDIVSEMNYEFNHPDIYETRVNGTIF